MSRSIIALWASIIISIMLLLMLRHPTCASYIAWMCCRMSDSIKHVWPCPDLSTTPRIVLDCTPSHLLTLFALLLLTIASVAALVWSRLRNIISTWQIRHAKHLKSRRGRYCFIVCLSVLSYWMISVRDKKHGTCLRNGRGCAAWALNSFCNHVVVSATSSNLCIMCCMNVL